MANNAANNIHSASEIRLRKTSTYTEEEFDDTLIVSADLSIIQGQDTLDAPGRIPFNTLQKPLERKKVLLEFIPGLPIDVKIISYERSNTTHLLNPNLYTICLSHGNFNWEIKKRYKHFLELHKNLTVHRAGLGLPTITLPSISNRKSKDKITPVDLVLEGGDVQNKKKKPTALPRFPKKPEVLIPFENLPQRKQQLQDYLFNLINISIYRYHSATAEFLEVSRISFIHDLGFKGKEGVVKKRRGSTRPGQSGCNCFGCCAGNCCLGCKHIFNDIICSRWTPRWFFIKDTSFGYLDPQTQEIKSVVLFDHGFEVASGIYNTGLNRQLQIVTNSRILVIKCSTHRQRRSWAEALKSTAANEAADFTKKNKYKSFAPVRNHIEAAWFVDGCNYMSAVADALEQAQEEIFIADWWLSPEIYLKRDWETAGGNYWRLDEVLKRRALAGVKIYILLYKEFQLALGLNSYYTKLQLSKLHCNIQVLRHPDHTRNGVFLWAHHEKIVVVDQMYAFLGGIDLCYGRWDDHEHALTDLGGISLLSDVSGLKKKTSTTPGGDNFYQMPHSHVTPNVIIEECHDSDEETKTETDANKVVDDDGEDSPKIQLEPGDFLLIPTAPSCQPVKMNTPEMMRKNPLINLGRNISSATKNIKVKSKEFVQKMHNQGLPTENDGLKAPVEKQRKLSRREDSAKYWIGKDYCNFIVKDFTDLDAPFEDFIDRHTTPRMPWHDVGTFVQGAAARDIARHFIQRWNATKLEKARLNTSYQYLLPKSYNTIEDKLQFNNLTKHRVQCQVLRSCSAWSAGFVDKEYFEQSIHDAYIEAINRSQHFIYIENQFFISLARDQGVSNLVAETLYRRIIRAYTLGEVFRVFVIMPLLPGFEGDVQGKSGVSLRAITHWNYASISRGGCSLLERLKEYGIEDPTTYVSFYGLRNHAVLNREPITELIYVHSKLMIVDDKLVICGSANINDRSLIGKRDSEIAVIIEDEEFDEGIMNQQPFKCGKYAGSLRKYLFREHLGLLDEDYGVDVSDPVCDDFYLNTWYETAKLNTEFYDKVFHCIPSSKVTTFEEHEEYIGQEPLYRSELNRANKMLEDIKGHLVLMPLDYLCKENLTPYTATVEGMMPTALWT